MKTKKSTTTTKTARAATVERTPFLARSIRFLDESLHAEAAGLSPVAGPPDSKTVATSKIAMPDDISEQSGISGYLVSHKLHEYSGLKRVSVTKRGGLATKAHKYAALASQIASDGDGAPAVGENYIKIWIDNAHANAGSNADYIWMYFGSNRRIKLWGIDRTRFPKGWWLSWDLNNVNPTGYLETIGTDAWDDITLVNDFGDGIKLDRIKIVHSGVTILDWNCNTWLDGSKGEAHGRINLTAPMLSQKLGQVDNSWIPQIHWAARELGKTDGTKYGSTGAWCSEFASWCLRKEMWSTPTGNIGSQVMEDFFDGIGRMYTRAQLLNGTYTLSAGDYLRFEWSDGGKHSGIFMYYVDTGSPTNETRIRTIEGNTGARVAVRTRTLQQLLSVGNTR